MWKAQHFVNLEVHLEALDLDRLLCYLTRALRCVLMIVLSYVLSAPRLRHFGYTQLSCCLFDLAWLHPGLLL